MENKIFDFDLSTTFRTPTDTPHSRAQHNCDTTLLTILEIILRLLVNFLYAGVDYLGSVLRKYPRLLIAARQRHSGQPTKRKVESGSESGNFKNCKFLISCFEMRFGEKSFENVAYLECDIAAYNFVNVAAGHF